MREKPEGRKQCGSRHETCSPRTAWDPPAEGAKSEGCPLQLRPSPAGLLGVGEEAWVWVPPAQDSSCGRRGKSLSRDPFWSGGGNSPIKNQGLTLWTPEASVTLWCAGVEGRKVPLTADVTLP